MVVSASCNQAHKHKLSKLSVNWHGPYEVVDLIPGAPSKLKVRLVGAPLNKIFTVSWRKVRRIAGPTLAITQEIQNIALHDQQEFTVDSLVDWGIDDDGNIVIRVHWLGFEDSEDTWEPMSQLFEDVHSKICKYVKRENAPQLTEEFNKLMKAKKAKSAKFLNKKYVGEETAPFEI